MEIGDRIRNIADQKGLTAYRIAKNARMSQAYLCDLLHNRQSNPSLSILKKIASALNVSLSDLIEEGDRT